MAPLFARPRPSAVTHGAALDFETLYPDGDLAPVRLRPHQDTLLRVISGDVRLVIDRVVRLLGTGEEAVVPAGMRHRLSSLEAAAYIYRSRGFELVGQQPPSTRFGIEFDDQVYERALRP